MGHGDIPDEKDPAKHLEEEAEALEREARDLEHEAERLEQEAKALERKEPIVIVFNEKYRVVVRGRNQTGRSLKEIAIKEGAQIQLDFVLSVELGGGKTKLIGDTDDIEIKEGERFLAIPNDDNS